MSSARVNLPPELDRMPLFALLDCIKQANLGTEDMWLVQQYIVKRIPQDDLAAELGWTRRTVSVHLKKSFARMVEMSAKLYGKYA